MESVSAPPFKLSNVFNVWIPADVTPALIVSAPEPPVTVSIPAVSVCVALASTVVVAVVEEVVVVDEPPQAASDSAISDTPPALAAFLAFLDSQAFTSLLVAFIIVGYEKYLYISRLTDITVRLEQGSNNILQIYGIKMTNNNHIIFNFVLLRNIFDGEI